MKEAFGGTFMLKLFMVFFIIYVTFIFIALNFAKHYRIKNYVINYLEQNQYKFGQNLENSELSSYLDNVPYTFNNEIAEDKCKQTAGSNEYDTFKGVCIIQYGQKVNGVREEPYYKVIVYFGAVFPWLNINITIPISGETTVIRQPV